MLYAWETVAPVDLEKGWPGLREVLGEVDRVLAELTAEARVFCGEAGDAAVATDAAPESQR